MFFGSLLHTVCCSPQFQTLTTAILSSFCYICLKAWLHYMISIRQGIRGACISFWAISEFPGHRVVLKDGIMTRLGFSRVINRSRLGLTVRQPCGSPHLLPITGVKSYRLKQVSNCIGTVSQHAVFIILSTPFFLVCKPNTYSSPKALNRRFIHLCLSMWKSSAVNKNGLVLAATFRLHLRPGRKFCTVIIHSAQLLLVILWNWHRWNNKTFAIHFLTDLHDGCSLFTEINTLAHPVNSGYGLGSCLTLAVSWPVHTDLCEPIPLDISFVMPAVVPLQL